MLIFTLVNDEFYMQRSLELAAKGSGWVSPNPMVGAVLVHKGQVIGEGYHEYFGGPHAEVNCIQSVAPQNAALISSSTLYVSLEPCNHFGKTPPCTEFIIRNQIPSVIVACTDPHSRVCGTGINRLVAAGVKVTTGVLQKEAASLNKYFFMYHRHQRPYVILKWAQTNDGFISDNSHRPLKISNPITDRLVHGWRANSDAILVGTNTLIHDNPSLTTRLWPGKNPLRVVIDKQLQAPLNHVIYNNESSTLIFNSIQSSQTDNNEWIRLTDQKSWVRPIVQILHQRGIQSLLVEGGSQLLQHFLQEQLWDELRVITNTHLQVQQGKEAPKLINATSLSSQFIRNDRIDIYQPPNQL